MILKSFQLHLNFPTKITRNFHKIDVSASQIWLHQKFCPFRLLKIYQFEFSVLRFWRKNSNVVKITMECLTFEKYSPVIIKLLYSMIPIILKLRLTFKVEECVKQSKQSDANFVRENPKFPLAASQNGGTRLHLNEIISIKLSPCVQSFDEAC